jgi:hypothetical protein
MSGTNQLSMYFESDWGRRDILTLVTAVVGRGSKSPPWEKSWQHRFGRVSLLLVWSAFQ